MLKQGTRLDVGWVARLTTTLCSLDLGNGLYIAIANGRIRTPTDAKARACAKITRRLMTWREDACSERVGSHGAGRERERDLLQVPHFFVGTLQPL